MKTIFIHTSPGAKSDIINIFWNRFHPILTFLLLRSVSNSIKRPSKIKDNSELEQHSVFKYHIRRL